MLQFSCLPLPWSSPRWPRPGHLTARALNWLLAGDVFDHPALEARNAVELRARGGPVETEAAPTSDKPSRIIGRYALPPAVAALACARRRG